MTTDARRSPIPEFVFVCGAVGSGNTFMFGSLTKDEHVYGINEDGLGTTMRNFLRPENASTPRMPSTNSWPSCTGSGTTAAH